MYKLFRFRKRDFNESMHKTQKRMLSYAHRIAVNNQLRLDFTNDSVEIVEKILTKIAEEIRNESIAPKEIHKNEAAMGISEIFGLYIVECIEMNYGQGVWYEVDPNGGEPRFAFKLPGGGPTVFPLEWVMKKLVDPKGYSVTKVYGVFVFGRSL